MKKQSQLTNEIKKLQYQLSYSQHINKQLSHYLAQLYKRSGTPMDKIPSMSNMNVDNVQILSPNNTFQQLQELYYVEPLIMCYEESLYLLRQELNDLREHSEEICKQVNNVTKENQFLRKQLSVKLELLSKSQNLGIDIGFLKVQKGQLVQIKKILEQKVQFLTRKNKQLENDLSEVHSSKSKMLNQTQINRIKDGHSFQLKNLQTKIIRLESDLDIVKNQLQNEQSLLKQQNNKVEALEETVSLLRNEVKISKQNLQKHLITKQKSEQSLASELEIVKQQLKASTRKQQQLFNKMITLQSQVQDKTNRTNNLNIQNSQLQANNNNMLQMLEAYEVKVSTINQKLKKLESEHKSVGEDHSEMSKKIEVFEWKMQQKDEQMARKQQQWRKERDRLNKVWEQRIQAIRKGIQVAPQHDNDL